MKILKHNKVTLHIMLFATIYVSAPELVTEIHMEKSSLSICWFPIKTNYTIIFLILS